MQIGYINIYKNLSKSNYMNKWLEILLGLILVVGAILVAFCFTSWFAAALMVLKGGLLWALLGLGLLFILLGISDLKG